jgi:hypothetical protein
LILSMLATNPVTFTSMLSTWHDPPCNIGVCCFWFAPLKFSCYVGQLATTYMKIKENVQVNMCHIQTCNQS